MWTIYKHTMPDNKVYIGMTDKPVEQRWGSYGSNYLSQHKMKYAILRFGWDNIKHEILEDNIPTQSLALQKETALIEQYNSIENGYNNKRSVTAKPQLPKTPRASLKYPVYQLDQNTGAIIKGYSSLKEASLENNINMPLLRNACVQNHSRCHGYYWCFQKDYETWELPTDWQGSPCICVETKERFSSIAAAARVYQTHPKNISKCCNRLIPTYNNLHFAFLKDYSENWEPPLPIPKKERKYRQGIKEGRNRPVYCEETQMIYSSATVFATALGVTRVAVYHCCNGRSTKIYKRNSDNTKTPYHVRWAD